MRIFRFILAIATLLLAGMLLPAVAAEKGKENLKVVTSEELKAMIERREPGLVVIDARTPEEYQEVHIKGAVNIPEPKLSKDRSLLAFDKSAKLVFYCNGIKCGKSKKAAIFATELGYPNILVYAEGMPVWEEKGYAIYAGPEYEKKVETTRIKPKELQEMMAAKPGTFMLVDVRDPNEFAAGHIPGAINLPVARFAALSGKLEKEKQIVVYCNSGGRSYNAYRKLQKLAYPNIRQAIFADWEDAGLPVEK